MRRRPIKSGVKDGGSTIAVPLILMGLITLEVGGMWQVAVKCIDMSQNTNCEGSLLGVNDAEARKRGDQTGLDTLVVHALNDEYSMLAIYS